MLYNTLNQEMIFLSLGKLNQTIMKRALIILAFIFLSGVVYTQNIYTVTIKTSDSPEVAYAKIAKLLIQSRFPLKFSDPALKTITTDYASPGEWSKTQIYALVIPSDTTIIELRASVYSGSFLWEAVDEGGTRTVPRATYNRLKELATKYE